MKINGQKRQQLVRNTWCSALKHYLERMASRASAFKVGSLITILAATPSWISNLPRVKPFNPIVEKEMKLSHLRLRAVHAGTKGPHHRWVCHFLGCGALPTYLLRRVLQKQRSWQRELANDLRQKIHQRLLVLTFTTALSQFEPTYACKT